MGTFDSELEKNAAWLARRGKGILAADESVGTVGKRLVAMGLENVEETRRAFREVLICADGNEEALSGVIMYHETVFQRDASGERFVDVLVDKGILPGVKVDTGLKPVDGSPGETYTSGMDGLMERCVDYYSQGIRFAKWRSALLIDSARGLPTDAVVAQNADGLAAYAKVAQDAGLVPLVEPEILISGRHSQELFAQVSSKVLRKCYEALAREGVFLKGTLLKPMMIMPGVDNPDREMLSPEQVARVTLDVMRAVVPSDVPGIMFLSGGMSETQATLNLNALNKLADKEENAPWTLSFSFGRALQTSPMKFWGGRESKMVEASQKATELARANAQAQLGKFSGAHPSIMEGKSLHETFRGWRSGEDPKGI